MSLLTAVMLWSAIVHRTLLSKAPNSGAAQVGEGVGAARRGLRVWEEPCPHSEPGLAHLLDWFIHSFEMGSRGNSLEEAPIQSP